MVIQGLPGWTYMVHGAASAAACSAESHSAPISTGGSTSASTSPLGGLGQWQDLGNAAAPAHSPPDPTVMGAATLGGTMTFMNIGAPGYWGRRIEGQPGDPKCDVQSKTINYPWGASDFCCRTKHIVTSDRITPFNEQVTLVLDGPMRVKQLAAYFAHREQPFRGIGITCFGAS